MLWMRCWRNDGIMLAHRLRRWPRIIPSLDQHLVFVAYMLMLHDVVSYWPSVADCGTTLFQHCFTVSAAARQVPKKHGIHTMLVQCWPIVYDVVPTLCQFCYSVLFCWGTCRLTGRLYKQNKGTSEQTRYIATMPGKCWPTVSDVGPAFTHHWSIFRVCWDGVIQCWVNARPASYMLEQHNHSSLCSQTGGPTL